MCVYLIWKKGIQKKGKDFGPLRSRNFYLEENLVKRDEMIFHQSEFTKKLKKSV